MARIDINVASRPFLNARAFAASLVLLGLLGVSLTIYNVYDVSYTLIRRSHIKSNLTQQQTDVARLRRATDEAKSQPTLKRRKRILETARFATTLINGRTLSWTQLFDDLEDVIPRDVRILSIHPDVDTDGINLRMDCMAKTNKAKLEFFKNLYEPPFDDPHVQVETKDGKQTKFTIRCSYGRNENEPVLASSASGATP